jgi:hypothetical protein
MPDRDYQHTLDDPFTDRATCQHRCGGSPSSSGPSAGRSNEAVEVFKRTLTSRFSVLCQTHLLYSSRPGFRTVECGPIVTTIFSRLALVRINPCGSAEVADVAAVDQSDLVHLPEYNLTAVVLKQDVRMLPSLFYSPTPTTCKVVLGPAILPARILLVPFTPQTVIASLSF